MSLAKLLPAPRSTTIAALNNSSGGSDGAHEPENEMSLATQQRPSGPPPYGQRKGWIPRTQADFGDGGAFPEIHAAQYPNEMGRKKKMGATKTLTLRVDESGKIQFDALARRGHGEKRLIHSQLKDIVPLDVRENDTSFMRPSEEEIAATTEKTKAALEKIVNNKISSQSVKTIQSTAEKAPTYVRYKPQSATAGFNDRVIRMVEAPVDPLQPPKFKHKRLPAAPGSPPPPVMHSPPRKVTVEEQKEWYIPPCISNWKNAKGYTIPLDKRLAADGRGLQEVTINDKFAKFAEALYIADRHAREEVEKRAKMQKKLAEKEKEAKEAHLRELAQKAREERTVFDTTAIGGDDRYAGEREGVDEAAVRERDQLRRDRERDIQRQIRMSHMGSETKARVIARSLDRDISEKIALGMAAPTASKELMYDQRLFSQAQASTAGFRDEDAYNLYDKPLFTGTSAANIYRPKSLDDDLYGGAAGADLEKLTSENRFVPERGFQGTESTAPREGPVQFEKQAEDPFGLDKFLTETKKGKRGLDVIGQQSMIASSSGSRQDYESRGSTSRSNIQFEGSKRQRQD